MSSACEVDICGVVGMHALQLASRNAQRAARLEQQLRRRPRQGRLLPLQQPAQAFLRGRARWTSRRSSPAPWASENTFGTCVGRVKAEPDELRALLHRRSATGTIARLRRRGRVHRRSADYLRRRRRGRRFRICRSCCATSARTASSITWPPTCPRVAQRRARSHGHYLGWNVAITSRPLNAVHGTIETPVMSIGASHEPSSPESISAR